MTSHIRQPNNFLSKTPPQKLLIPIPETAGAVDTTYIIITPQKDHLHVSLQLFVRAHRGTRHDQVTYTFEKWTLLGSDRFHVLPGRKVGESAKEPAEQPAIAANVRRLRLLAL